MNSDSEPSGRREVIDRRATGVAALADQHDMSPVDVIEHLINKYGTDWTEELCMAVGGGVWSPDCLSLRDRSLIVLAALSAQGGVETRLPNHVRWAIKHGATRRELERMCTLLSVYIGYPKSSLALEVVRETLDALERDATTQPN
jgi:4-carboxymuconolactone decarboxylase